MDRRLALDDAALLILSTRPGMAFNHIDFFNQNPFFFAIDLEDFADLTRFLAGNNFYLVVFFYQASIFYHQPFLHLDFIGNLPQPMQAFSWNPGYNTSGASEMIFINRFPLNSLATGPNMRVPMGSLWALIKTAELSSNRIKEPSGL
jgi:hypothetical protein